MVAIACVLGGGAALMLFGLTRSRFALLLMTLLMLAISGCALLAAFILSSFVLLPVGAIQILAILLLESRESRFWMEGVPIMNAGNRHHACAIEMPATIRPRPAPAGRGADRAR